MPTTLKLNPTVQFLRLNLRPRPHLHEHPTVHLHQGHEFTFKTTPYAIAGLMAQLTTAPANARILARDTNRKLQHQTPWVVQLLVQLKQNDGSRRLQSVFANYLIM